jgi:DnaJ-related protein SCJ1
LIGFKRRLTHLDGHIVEVERTVMTEPSQVVTVAGEGMPKYQSASDKGTM